MKEKLTRKAINFDLDTKELLKYFKNEPVKKYTF